MKDKTEENFLIEVNKNVWKKILFLLFLIIVIIISAYFGIKCAKNNFNINNENVETKENKNIETEEVKKNRLPIYTQVGKEKVKKVYTSTSDAKRVFLTFDDGPSSNVTPLILDVLKQNNIKATFFILGSRVEQNPSIVKRAYEEGHYIANHGYSHVYSAIYQSYEALLDEYNKTELAIRNAIGVSNYSSHLFRFPGGSVGGKYNDLKKQYVQKLPENEIFYVDWNCLSEDATGKRTKEQLVQYIKNTSANKNSVVVLMHDAGDKILTYETLQEVIDYFKENQYSFYNFYDLIECE